jgi:hypothetical protein
VVATRLFFSVASFANAGEGAFFLIRFFVVVLAARPSKDLTIVDSGLLNLLVVKFNKVDEFFLRERLEIGNIIRHVE